MQGNLANAKNKIALQRELSDCVGIPMGEFPLAFSAARWDEELEKDVRFTGKLEKLIDRSWKSGDEELRKAAKQLAAAASATYLRNKIGAIADESTRQEIYQDCLDLIDPVLDEFEPASDGKKKLLLMLDREWRKLINKRTHTYSQDEGAGLTEQYLHYYTQDDLRILTGNDVEVHFLLHFVWTSRNRRRIFREPNLKRSAFRAIRQVCDDYDIEVKACETGIQTETGERVHADSAIHLVVEIANTMITADELIKEVKKSAEKAILEDFPGLKSMQYVFTRNYFLSDDAKYSPNAANAFIERQASR